MNRQEKLRYEMYLRVQNFGNAHRKQFPESSSAGQAFAAVAAAAAAFDAHATARLVAAEASRKAKAAARHAIGGRLRVIARTARLVAEATPAGVSLFTPPSNGSDAAMLVTARAVIRDGQPALDQFVPLGMSPTIITELQELVDRFGEADRKSRDGKAGRMVAQDGMRSALKAGVAGLRTLDVVVPNTAEPDPVMRAAWQRARRWKTRGKAPNTPAPVPASGQPETPPAPPKPPAAPKPDAPTVEAAGGLRQAS